MKKLLLCLCIVLSLCGCKQSQKETITLGEWLKKVNEKAGILSHCESQPYYMNVSSDSLYFDDVQAAVEWGIIDTSFPFDPENVLTKEWAAYTLMNLAMKKDDPDNSIKDLSSSRFQEQVSAAVSSGLMKTDKRNLFHPQEMMEKEEALQYLDQVICYINQREIDTPQLKVEWKDNETPKDIKPITFEKEAGTASFSLQDDLTIGDIVEWTDEQNHLYCFEIEDIHKEKDCQIAVLKEINLLEETDQMDIENEVDIDFSQAQIEDGNGNVIQEGATGDSVRDHIHLMSERSMTRSFQISGFNVSIQAQGKSCSAEVTKNMKHGSKMYASLKVNNVHTTYAWHSQNGALNDAFFKLQFTTDERIGVKNSGYKNLYGDFSKVKADAFLQSLTSMFRQKKEVEQATLTLCTFQIPIPGSPVLNLGMSLQLHLYASGRCELALTQSNTIGCEIRNGHMRLIRENTNNSAASLKAAAKVSGGIRFALNVINGAIMDANVEAGAVADLSTTAHIFDEEGNRTVYNTEVSPDVADEVAADNPDVLICSDINAHWVMDVLVNSAETVAGKFGFSSRINILNEGNAPLFPGLKKHMENWQFVDHCTRKNRPRLVEADPIHVSEKITLADYSIAIQKGKSVTLRITGLPAGYEADDLEYASSKPEVAEVDENGCVTALQSGSTVITISTKDKEHEIHCNILVPQIAS